MENNFFSGKNILVTGATGGLGSILASNLVLSSRSQEKLDQLISTLLINSKITSLASLVWPKFVDRKLEPLRNRTIAQISDVKPKEQRKWKLAQIESSIACNLKCIMCPWRTIREKLNRKGHMSQEIWDSIEPYLNDIQSVDFTGGGEPLLQKNLFDWIIQGKVNGCEVGFLTNGLLFNKKTAENVINCDLDWIAFSIDGATKEVYERIREGSNFDRVCDNISILADMRIGEKPLIMFNFVIMTENAHQLEDVIRLAAELGADQVNFKQCDVIRGDSGKGFGLFAPKETREIKRLQKSLSRARRIGRKLKVNTTAFSFTPEEQPVCDQDPRSSFFVRYDGAVSPCINLAMGGPTSFLGKDVEMPTVSYGRLPDKKIIELWESKACNIYKKKFGNREKIHNAVLTTSDIGPSLIKLQEAFQKAVEAMPVPPKGCEICHYLFDI